MLNVWAFNIHLSNKEMGKTQDLFQGKGCVPWVPDFLKKRESLVPKVKAGLSQILQLDVFLEVNLH